MRVYVLQITPGLAFFVSWTLLAAAQRSTVCMLYLYGLPFVVVLPLLLLAGCLLYFYV